MENINSQTIDLILSKMYDRNFWFFELGRAEIIIDESPDIEHQFMSSFFERGEAIWNRHKEKLKDFVCDKEKNQPKEFIKDLTEQDIVYKILEFFTAGHHIAIAIAIPLCGLALKIGLSNLCG